MKITCLNYVQKNVWKIKINKIKFRRDKKSVNYNKFVASVVWTKIDCVETQSTEKLASKEYIV